MSTRSDLAGRLIVARHGCSRANAAGRIQGHLDAPLDRRGQLQAAALAVDLAGRFPAPTVAAVVTSDLERARATACAVARATGAPLVVDPRLREVDAGRWAGRRRHRVEREEPEHWTAWLAGTVAAPGALESLDQAGCRVAAALLAAWVRAGPAAHPDRVVVAVAHGPVVRAALARLASAGLIEATGTGFDKGGRPIHLGNAEFAELLPASAGEGRPSRSGETRPSGDDHRAVAVGGGSEPVGGSRPDRAAPVAVWR